MPKVTLYKTETCPKCAIMIQRMTEQGIEFDTVTSLETMESKGIRSVPTVELPDGTLMNYTQAWNWLNEQQA